MEVWEFFASAIGAIAETSGLVEAIGEGTGDVIPSAIDSIHATNEAIQATSHLYEAFGEGGGGTDGLGEGEGRFGRMHFHFHNNNHHRPPTTVTPPRYSSTGIFTTPPPSYDLTYASPYDDIVEHSPCYGVAAAPSNSSNPYGAPSRPYTTTTASLSSPYNTDAATGSLFDDNTNLDSIAVHWTDTRLQSQFGTSYIPERFLVEQRDGVFRTRCKVPIDGRGVVPKGAACTSYAASTDDIVIVTWIDTRLQERIGPYDIPERYLARLRDGVFRTTTKLTIKDRGTVPKGSICKLLYA